MSFSSEADMKAKITHVIALVVGALAAAFAAAHGYIDQLVALFK